MTLWAEFIVELHPGTAYSGIYLYSMFGYRPRMSHGHWLRTSLVLTQSV